MYKHAAAYFCRRNKDASESYYWVGCGGVAGWNGCDVIGGAFGGRSDVRNVEDESDEIEIHSGTRAEEHHGDD